MWSVKNETPFSVDSCFLRGLDGAETWIVALKATYQINPDGTLEIAKEQKPIRMNPVFYGEAGKSSLKYENDLILTKKNTDISLLGSAYAPDAKTTELLVSMRIGNLTKSLLVRGDSFYQDQALRMGTTSPEPFEKIPIRYERAFGGIAKKDPDSKKIKVEPKNPVGRGITKNWEEKAGKPAPNIYYPDWDQNKGPAGFSPIPANWEPRLSHAGTYNKNWEEELKPLLPADFNPLFFQSVPADQQADGFLKGGEEVTLRNLTPEGFLSFSLPVLEFNFKTELAGKLIERKPDLHGLIIEPDEKRLSLIWHSALRCHRKEHLLKKTLITLADQVVESQ